MDRIFKSTQYKYERLKYCNYCGSNDHNENNCQKKKEDNKANKDT